PQGAMETNPAPVTGAKVTLAGIDNGEWSVEWWDTLSGKRISEVEATASGGSLRLEPPSFTADIAARIKKHLSGNSNTRPRNFRSLIAISRRAAPACKANSSRRGVRIPCRPTSDARG